MLRIQKQIYAAYSVLIREKKTVSNEYILKKLCIFILIALLA